MAITLEAEYGYVIWTAVAICLECMFTGYYIMSVRQKTFTEEFMEQFHSEHSRAFGLPPAKHGYPDMGSGRYSDKLEYKEWVIFNNAQRAHYNFVEGLTPTVVVTLVAGISFPIYASILGCLILVGRFLYASFYTTPKGAQARFPGVTLFQLGFWGNLVLGCISAYNLLES
mmetsp:Transcript_21965/g.24797  ORF Transcript_21965/g.24797 Transcript_21965/m.24797 type:complete len:171 (-) Transcript_21965:158-670(-)